MHFNRYNKNISWIIYDSWCSTTIKSQLERVTRVRFCHDARFVTGERGEFIDIPAVVGPIFRGESKPRMYFANARAIDVSDPRRFTR